MSVGEIWIDLQGAAVRNHGFGKLATVKISVALREKFLLADVGVAITSDKSETKAEKEYSCEASGIARSAEGEVRNGHDIVHQRAELQFSLLRDSLGKESVSLG